MKKGIVFTKYTLKIVANKIVINSVLLVIIAIGWTCASDKHVRDNENIAERKTVQNVLNCVKFSKECNLKPFVFLERALVNEESLQRDVELLHHLTTTYYYPGFSELAVEYDTMNSIVKYLNVIVSFKNSKTDTAIIANATFSFDYTKKYLPDTIVSVFYIEIFKELNFLYENDTMSTIEID